MNGAKQLARVEYARRVTGRDRVVYLLAWLHEGRCRVCGRLRYRSRVDARHAGLLAHPGGHVRAMKCCGFWHVGSPDRGRADTPTLVDPAERGAPGQRIGLDRYGRAERACPRPGTARRNTGGTTHGSRPATGPACGRGGPDPLEDACATYVPDTVPGRRSHGRRPAMGATASDAVSGTGGAR
jgi:hypothetical protein